VDKEGIFIDEKERDILPAGFLFCKIPAEYHSLKGLIIFILKDSSKR
jgi:hypothetical protein